MEEHKKLDYDSDIIICDDVPETISLSASPEKNKKQKTKKRRRKVKRAVNFNSNMETLLITQKLKVKKTKFKCVININTVCKSDSIERFHTNVCKKDAYYHRIVPNCLREMCSGSASCCRSTISRDYNKYVYPKAGSVSPVSSISLTEVFSCNNISYEDVSNGSFSSVSEEKLDTLIKRTRQREKQLHNSHSTRSYITSTPTPKADDIASPFSIDIDKNSIHSDNTMILHPLSTEAYSPTSIDTTKIDNLETVDATNIDIDVPYSPTMTPDLIKMENLDYSPVDRSLQDDDIPYSPTYTPETITVDMDDLKRNSINIDMYQSYSPTFTPDIEINDLGNANIEYGNEPYSPTMTPDIIKIENLNYSVDRTDASETVNVGCSPRSPTVTPDFHKFTVTQTENSNKDNIHDVLYSPSSGSMKQDYLDGESTIIGNTNAPKFAILTSDQMKKENEKSHDCSNEIDYNMNNTIHCKIEKADHQRGMHE